MHPAPILMPAALPRRRSRLVLAILPLLVAGPALAEEAGNRTVLSFSEKLEAGFGSGGGDLTAITGLGFRADGATVGESYFVEAGLGLVAADLGGANDLSLGTPHLGLGYDRETQDSAFSAHLTYGRDRLERIRSLEEFLNETGGFDLPPDPSALVASGTEESFDAGLRLEMGRDAPFGLTLTADADRRVYSDSTDPLLLDSESRSLGAVARFSYAPQGNVTLGIGTSWDSLEGSGDSTSQSLTLGTSYDVSPVLSVSADAKVTSKSGDQTTSLGLGLDYALLKGSLALDLRQGEASLSWQQKLLTGSVSASLSHGADQTGDGTTDQLSLGYNQSITDLSSLGLGLFLSNTQAPGVDVTGTDVVASYSYRLTQDWGLNLGANYRLRDDAGTTTNSSGVFVKISRDFSFGR